MPTRQYVGARYVPKFANPIQWDSNNIYEPLEMVTYLNNTYTSKKPVPQGVDINNKEYWVLTGNYNAQVEQYRQEVEALKETITGVNANTKKWNVNTNGKIIFVGDSYGKLDTQNWDKYPKIVANILGLGQEGENWWNISQPSSNIASGGWLSFIKEWVSNNHGKEDSIGAIICAGGLNDSDNQWWEQVSSKIQELVSYCKVTFNNAVVYFGYCGWLNEEIASGDGRTSNYRIAVAQRYMRCSAYDARYLSGLENVYHDKILVSDDGIHPTQDGQTRIAEGIVSSLTTGYAPIVYKRDAPLTSTAGTIRGNVTQILENGFVTTYFEDIGIEFTAPTGYTAGNDYVIGKVSLPLSNAINFGTLILMVTDNSTSKNIVMSARIDVRKNGDVHLYCYGYSDGENTKQIIRINSFTISNTKSALDC